MRKIALQNCTIISPLNVIRTSVAHIEYLCRDVKKIRIIPAYQELLPEFEAGSNIEISVPKREGDTPTPYSIVNASDSSNSYDFIVAGNRVDPSSKNDWLIDNLRIGDFLDISEPRKGIEFSDNEHGHFLAGGSGITAFLSHFNSVDLTKKSYCLCHIVRDSSKSFIGLGRKLMSLLDISCVVTSEDAAFDIESFLDGKKQHAPIYVSGSRRLIEEVIEKAIDKGWSRQDIYWDKYALPDCKFQNGSSEQCC